LDFGRFHAPELTNLGVGSPASEVAGLVRVDVEVAVQQLPLDTGDDLETVDLQDGHPALTSTAAKQFVKRNGLLSGHIASLVDGERN